MPINDPRVLLVTGGAGFIGSNFVQKAVELGHRVIVLDAFTYAGRKENLEGFSGLENFELIVGDICDGALVLDKMKSLGIDTVINFAAESHVDRSITGASAFIQTNIVGTYTLLNASLQYWRTLGEPHKSRFRYIQVSTDEVYGSLGEEGKFSETSPKSPNSPYAASKAAGDHLVQAWHHTYGLPTIITNCSNNYGPRQFPEKLIPYMISCALSSRPLPVYGDGANVRDWIHVSDHCDGLLLALERGRPGATYCFGGNAERRNLDVVRAICSELDKWSPRPDGKKHESAITFIHDRPGHDRRYAIDDALAQRELGFTRNYDFEKGLADTVRWYLDNADWCEVVSGGLENEGDNPGWRHWDSSLSANTLNQ